MTRPAEAFFNHKFLLAPRNSDVVLKGVKGPTLGPLDVVAVDPDDPSRTTVDVIHEVSFDPTASAEDKDPKVE